MSGQTYPAYKPSGIEWLGKLPEHWEVKRIKYISKRITKGTTPTTLGKDFVDEGVKFLRVENISDDLKINVGNCKYIDQETNELLKRSQVKAGNVVIAIAGAIGRVAKVDNTILPANINQAVGLIDIDNNKLLPDWVSYSLSNVELHRIFIELTVQSAQSNLSLESVSNLSIFVPPKHEQKLIVFFLDRETSRIDKLIDKKQKQIELLQEKRSALISHVVTKGLDPNVKMKDSGVEWLGEVPEHWEMRKVARSFNIIGSGTTPRSDNSDYYNGNINWVTSTELREKYINETINKISKDALQDYSSLRIYKPGTLLIALYGATIGRLGILGIESTINQACCALSESKYFNSKFVFYWLLYYRPILISHSVGGGQQNLSQEDIKSLRIPCPKMKEQKQIIDFLDNEISKLDNLIQKIECSITVLNEYRNSLISATVTGKIDVRDEIPETFTDEQATKIAAESVEDYNK